jgi:hypothetical protein
MFLMQQFGCNKLAKIEKADSLLIGGISAWSRLIASMGLTGNCGNNHLIMLALD